MITPPDVDAGERELVEVTALTGADDRAFAKVPADTGLSDVADAAEEAQIEAEVEAVFSGARPAIAAGIAMLAVAVMVGGMFSGFQPRLLAAVGGLEGVYLAYRTQRARRFLLGQTVALAGTIGIAVLATLADPHGFQDLSRLPDIIRQAAAAGHVLRPPAPFDPGWRPMVTFLCATVGFAAAYAAIELRRPPLALLLPIPIVIFAGISQDKSAQVADGIAAFVLLAVGFTVLFRDTADGGGGKLSLEFEARRALRSAPFIAVALIVLIVVALTGALLPTPAYNPDQVAQLPQPVPLSGAQDRLLFSVKATISGPFRTGTLDVYDGVSFRLPPYAGSRFTPLGSSGVIDNHLSSGVEADFTLASLDGTVLPIPTRPVDVSESGDALLFEARTGTLRLAGGNVRNGLMYRVAAAAPPSAGELKAAQPDTGDRVDLTVPSEPAAVRSFIADAPSFGFARADYVRKKFLDTVTLAGAGLPGPVPPSKLVDMISGSKEGNPYEIVAGEVLLERWAGIPARIAYGFDQGAKQPDGTYQFRPRNGSSWMELNFNGLGFFPITGQPAHAKSTLGTNNQVNTDQNVLPSQDIVVEFFIPLRQFANVLLYEQLRPIVELVIAGLLVIGLLYVLWPIARRSWRTARRRGWALRAGPRARIAVAYAEFREAAVALGDAHYAEPPLAFLTAVADDEEHEEFAWLVTQCLWGEVEPGEDDVNAALELSRSLRSRLARAQPLSVRALAILSRLPLRHPFDIGLATPAQRRTKVA